MKPENRDGLLGAIAKARQWIDDLRLGRAATLAEIAAREGVGERYVRVFGDGFMHDARHGGKARSGQRRPVGRLTADAAGPQVPVEARRAVSPRRGQSGVALGREALDAATVASGGNRRSSPAASLAGIDTGQHGGPGPGLFADREGQGG
jgi:hypothetical protein